MNKEQEWNFFLQAAKEVESDYQLEVEKVKKLTAEIALFQKKYWDEKKKTEELTLNLNDLKKEIDRLRSIYPLQDLLAAKQAEVDRVKKAWQSIAREHPEHDVIESMVKAHIMERDQLRKLLRTAEERFQMLFEQASEATVKVPEF